VAKTRVTNAGLERRVVALAEQLGRLTATVQGKADRWVDQKKLERQLARVRDGAADLLERLSARRSPAAARPKTGKTQAGGRSGGKVDAPGKKHRKAPASRPGVRHSEESIPKANAARQLRRTRRKG
jgi:hypothetical protein